MDLHGFKLTNSKHTAHSVTYDNLNLVIKNTTLDEGVFNLCVFKIDCDGSAAT